MRDKGSLRSKIARTLWVMTALSILTASFFSGLILIRSYRESLRSQLEAAASSLITLGISDFAELEDFEQLDDFIEDALEMEKVDKIVRIFNASGKLIYTTVDIDYDRLPEGLTPPAAPGKPFFITLEGLSRSYESLVVPYSGARKKRFFLQVAMPIPRMAQILEDFWWKDLLLLVILSSIAFILSHRLSRRLTQTVLQIRKMSRYVAHEMRTPLTILQGEAEVILAKPGATGEDYRKVLKSSLEEIQRMSDIVSTVLKLGDDERSATRLQKIPVRLQDYLEENKARWEKTLGKPLELAVQAPPDTTRMIDPKLFYHLIDNLVRNIRDHAGPSSICRMTLLRIGDDVIVKLQDGGPGMPEDVLKTLNGGESLLPGAGVGLHLCQTIAGITKTPLRFYNAAGGGLTIEAVFEDQ